MILYSYCLEDVAARSEPGPDWERDRYFTDPVVARRTLLDLRCEVLSDPDACWRTMRMERLEIAPVGEETLLTLANHGVGPLIQRYDVLERID
mgnify:CR=1 FL=1